MAFKEGDIVRLVGDIPPWYSNLSGQNGKILQEWTEDLYMVDFFTDDDELYFFTTDELEIVPTTIIIGTVGNISMWSDSVWTTTQHDA